MTETNQNQYVYFFVSLFSSDTKWKSSYSLTVAKHFVVKYAFIYNTLYIGKDCIYIAALAFLDSMQEKIHLNLLFGNTN